MFSSCIFQKTWGSGGVGSSIEDLTDNYYITSTNSKVEEKELVEHKEKYPTKGNTVAKLRDSLSKLREHLDSLQRRRSKSLATETDVRTVINGMSQKCLSQSELPTKQEPEVTLSPDTFDPSDFMPVIDVSVENGVEQMQEIPASGKMDYDTGDTSMNESDTGSTGASFRGTNDSAYASDRTSYSSRWRRRGSYADSEQSSPET